jgi:hypothetical protein
VRDIVTPEFKAAMAAPTDKMRGMRFYHGCSNEQFAAGVLSDGVIRPRDGGAKPVNGTGWLAPINDRTYLTPSLKYAVIYVLGGDVAGGEIWERFVQKDGRYGHLFVVDGSALSDVQPDEDSVGELLARANIPWLESLARVHVAPSRLKGVKQGYYAYWSSVGKQLLRRMSEPQKLMLLDAGAHVANRGETPFVEAWRFDKLRCRELQKDGSNFFALAERIK